LTPPLGVAPIFAISMSESQSLLPSMRTFDKSAINSSATHMQTLLSFDQMVK
jgi:hypothetical protein